MCASGRRPLPSIPLRAGTELFAGTCGVVESGGGTVPGVGRGPLESPLLRDNRFVKWGAQFNDLSEKKLR